MPPIVRIILSIVAGVVAGSLMMNLIQHFSPYQPPPGVTYTQGTLPYLEWVRSLSDRAWMILLASMFAGSLTGGFVTEKFSPPARFPPPLITGFCILFYQIVQYLAFSNPLWVAVSACVGCMAFAWVGAWIKRRGF